MAKKTSASAASKAGGFDPYKVAVLVPCYNEEAAVAKVGKEFRVALPKAAIFVFDGAALGLISVGLAIPIIITFLETRTVLRLPAAVLSTGLMVLAILSFAAGLVRDTVARGRREMKLLTYLAHRAPGEERRRT